MKNPAWLRLVILSGCIPLAHLSYGSAGTEGAAFLEIPVGAGPAALGSAYTALADNAYAPVYNPAGLGYLPSTQFSAQHLSYLESNHYEFLSLVHPFKSGHSLGVSAQYLGTGDIAGTDLSGSSIGDFSSHYASYNLSYGHLLGKKFSLGLTGKIINAKIDDVSATAYAADLGAFYRPQRQLTFAAMLANLGSKLTFLDAGDTLPLAFRLGAAFRPNVHWLLTAEGVFPKAGPISGHTGVEWRPLELIALRAGYKSDTTKGLSALAGFTTGIGITAWGQELSYAWVPLGDLGDTHYISLLARFGQDEDRTSLIQYQQIKSHHSAANNSGRTGPISDPGMAAEPEYQNLMELLQDPVAPRVSQGDLP